MTKLNLGLCVMNEDGKVVTSKIIGSQWNVDLSQEHRRNAKECMARTQEIIKILTDTYRTQLKRSDIAELLDDFRVKEILLKNE